ncbi:hypothetical protein [Pseudanabaena sp. FACHB-2040]|uniref:hypothetical protein n=1 Tax=Pseudanabaena sp. FACHB-2040 TaxID=2692859 RepID=UPI0016856630|nr:hypothetical protein [Pseudanabaena sp. FACHB-2040]MBD2258538.1 hypothetical protein [Pseudanabaena sp. FACHB-2040]
MKPLIKKHFELIQVIESNYRLRDIEAGALKKAISACNEQIAIAPEVAQLFHQEFEALNQPSTKDNKQPLATPVVALPVHTGYTQLAIIREQQARFAEAICLCREAQALGWADDWDNRIARCQQKQKKQAANS